MANFDNLRITDRELDTLTDLDIGDVTMGWAYRQTAFSASRRLSFIGEQLLTLGVTAIFCLPVTLLLVRSVSGDNVAAVWRWLPFGMVSAVAVAIAWFFYRWREGKRLLTLSHLLDEIDRFNEMVAAVEILEELNAAKNSAAKNGRSSLSPSNLENREEVIEVLHLTRESLICGLMTESIMRKHQQLIARQQEMFSNIERNLATLQQLQVGDEANEYSRLLNEAIQIGTSVQKELSGY
ncbi:MAG: hypothetical protein WBA01_05085 [Phormidesmis sp.]